MVVTEEAGRVPSCAVRRRSPRRRVRGRCGLQINWDGARVQSQTTEHSSVPNQRNLEGFISDEPLLRRTCHYTGLYRFARRTCLDNRVGDSEHVYGAEKLVSSIRLVVGCP